MIPEEDRPPAWLRGYEDIEADISEMEEFAAKLDAEVRTNYGPHAQSLYADMTTQIPTPYAAFQELAAFLVEHNAAEALTARLIYDYESATGGFAIAADRISKQYRESDAFASARVNDVLKAFEGTRAVTTGAAIPGTDPVTNPATSTDHTVPEVPTHSAEAH